MPTKTTLTAMAVTLVLLFGLLGCAGMGGTPTPYEGYTNVYLQNNIHGYTKAARGGKTEYIASYANYVQPDTGHFFVPLNTAVSVGKYRVGFTVTRLDNNQLIYFEYRAGNMGRSSRGTGARDPGMAREGRTDRHARSHQIWLDGPHGVFSMDREQAMGYVFIAGGVGITPLHSMLQTMVDREDVRPVLLFYGSEDWEDLTFREELDELSNQMNLKVIYVLDNPPEGWEGETGYVTADVLRRYLPKQYKRFIYFICGPDPLMDAMEEALPQLGVPRENVQTERFAMV